MPNGGVPRWLLIRPEDGSLVLVSEGTSLRLVTKEDFENQGAAARTMGALTEAEAFALMRHLSYWFEHRPPVDGPAEPQTVFRDW